MNDILAHDIDYWIGLADFAHEGQYRIKDEDNYSNKLTGRSVEVAGETH